MEINHEGFRNTRYATKVICKTCGCDFTANESAIKCIWVFQKWYCNSEAPIFSNYDRCYKVYCPSCQMSNNVNLPTIVQNRVYANMQSYNLTFPGCNHGLPMEDAKYKILRTCFLNFTIKEYSVICKNCKVMYIFGMFELTEDMKKEIERITNNKIKEDL